MGVGGKHSTDCRHFFSHQKPNSAELQSLVLSTLSPSGLENLSLAGNPFTSRTRCTVTPVQVKAVGP